MDIDYCIDMIRDSKILDHLRNSDDDLEKLLLSLNTGQKEMIPEGLAKMSSHISAQDALKIYQHRYKEMESRGLADSPIGKAVYTLISYCSHFKDANVCFLSFFLPTNIYSIWFGCHEEKTHIICAMTSKSMHAFSH